MSYNGPAMCLQFNFRGFKEVKICGINLFFKNTIGLELSELSEPYFRKYIFRYENILKQKLTHFSKKRHGLYV
jgi:hypothetical protein